MPQCASSRLSDDQRHVSHMMSKMARDGLVRKQRRVLEILDYEALYEEAQFDETYIQFDLRHLFEGHDAAQAPS